MTEEKMSRPQLYMKESLWVRFRIACLERRISASQVIADLVVEQLERWQQEEQPATPRKRPR